MTTRNFPDLDQHAADKELRDRIRAVIRGLQKTLYHTYSIAERDTLEHTLASLQPIKTGTNIGRLEIGVNTHWENKSHSKISDKVSCALIILRQLIINYWDYLLEGTDESLKPDGQIENHLELLEGYLEQGLEHCVVVGDVRQGYWLMPEGEYRAAMEDVR